MGANGFDGERRTIESRSRIVATGLISSYRITANDDNEIFDVAQAA